MLFVTGGASNRSMASVEVLSPSGVRLPCSVPDLPAPRYRHTQDGEVACGGSGVTATRTSCVSLTASGWTTSHQLLEMRDEHVSWRSPDGLLLMGGNFTQTTELLSDTNSSSLLSFDPEYDTR